MISVADLLSLLLVEPSNRMIKKAVIIYEDGQVSHATAPYLKKAEEKKKRMPKHAG